MVPSYLSALALRALAIAAIALASCAPSRGALFDPVARDIAARLGDRVPARATWHDGDPSRDADVQRLLDEPLTADRAAAVALRASSQLQADFDDLAVRGADVGAATAPAGPHLDGAIRYDHSTTIELGALQDLRDLLLAPARRGAASADLEAARRRAVRSAVDVAARARTGFYDAVAAQQIVRMQRRIVDATDAGAELAQALHAAGNVSDLALARERAFFAQARLDLVAAEAVARDRRERLTAVLGLSSATAWRATDELPDPPAALPSLDELETRAVDRSLELDELRWSARAAGKRLGLARWQTALPEVSVGVSAERDAGDWSVGPAAALRFPLGELAGGARGRAAAEARRLGSLYRARDVEIRAAARAARARLVAAHQRAVELHDVVLPLRKTILEQTLLQYNAMNATPFELLTARQEQVAAQRAHVEAVRDYWIAQAAVDQLLAGATPGLSMDAAPMSAASRGDDHGGTR